MDGLLEYEYAYVALACSRIREISKWFPSYSEIVQIAEEIAERQHQARENDRLMARLTDGSERPPTLEQRERIREMICDLQHKLAMPPRGQG